MQLPDVPVAAATDADGRVRRLWRMLGRLLVAAVVVLSLAPSAIELPGEQGDKMGHAVAYAVLMGWFAQLHAARPERKALAVGFIALGVAIECVQAFMPSRQFSVADMAVNALGVALGWLAAPPRGPDVLRRIERRFRGRAIDDDRGDARR